MAKSFKFLLIFLLTVDAAHAAPPAKPRPYKPITPPDYQWVDAEGKWSRANGGAQGDAAGNAANGSGNGNGKGKVGSGSGSGNSGNGIEFTQGPAGGAKAGVGNANGKDALSGTTSTPGGSIEIHDKWWPICAFMDESVPEDVANQSIKQLVEEANKCGVNAVIWPKTVKSGSWGDGNPDTINQRQVKACNIPKSLAKAGSTTAFVPFEDAAAEMCASYITVNGKEVPDPAVAGCAEMRGGVPPPPPPTDPNIIARNKQTRKQHTHKTNSEGVAPSIESKVKGWSGSVMMHEAQGHSQMGKPNGKSLGVGIGMGGNEEETEEGGASGGWTSEGCKVLLETALPNDRRFGFDPNRQNYYVKPRDPSAYYDLANDPPIFQESKNFVLNKGNGSVVTPPGQTITFKDDAKGQNPASEEKKAIDKKGQTTETADGEDTRHRRKNVVNALLESLKEESGLVEDPTRAIARKPSAPPNSDPAKASPRLGYDDNAAKGKVGSSGGETVTSADPSPVDIYSGANAPGDSSGLAVGSRDSDSSGSYAGGTGKGAAIGFDESAPKGGLAGGGPGAGNSAYGTAGGNSGALSRVVGSLNGEYKRTSGLDDEEDFFDEVGEDGKKRRRKQKRTTSLRESPQREPREPSAVGRASRSQRAPASSP